MDKLKEKLSRLMYGRYGIDQLGNFMIQRRPVKVIIGTELPYLHPGTRPDRLGGCAHHVQEPFQTVCGKPEIPGTEKPRRRILPRRNPCIQG